MKQRYKKSLNKAIEVKLSLGLGPKNTDHNAVIGIHVLQENSSSILGRTELSLEEFFSAMDMKAAGNRTCINTLRLSDLSQRRVSEYHLDNINQQMRTFLSF